MRYQVLCKRKGIADQNPTTSAIRLQVKIINLETYRFRKIDLGTGIVYLTVERLKRGKKMTISVREPAKTRPKTFFKK